MKSLKTALLGLMFIFSAPSFAETGTFQVSGMTCKACVDMVKAKVCNLEGVTSCEVKVGTVKMTTKPGATLDPKKVEELIVSAGDYKVVKSEIKK